MAKKPTKRRGDLNSILLVAFERSGLNREGTFTSIYSFMEKTAFAIGPLVIGLLLEASGYSSDSADAASPDTIRAILLAAAVIPAAASALSAVALRYYDLDQRMRSLDSSRS